MTRDEINRKISELREASADWTADENWPTLLREMPDPVIKTDALDDLPGGIERQWWCQFDSGSKQEGDHYDLGTAVCQAWLLWQESQ